jgi:hypothetical protein
LKMSKVTLLQDSKYGPITSMTIHFSSLTSFIHQSCQCILADSKCAVSVSAHSYFQTMLPWIAFLCTVYMSSFLWKQPIFHLQLSRIACWIVFITGFRKLV